MLEDRILVAEGHLTLVHPEDCACLIHDFGRDDDIRHRTVVGPCVHKKGPAEISREAVKEFRSAQSVVQRLEHSQRCVHSASGQKSLSCPGKKERAHMDDKPPDERTGEENIGSSSQDAHGQAFPAGPAEDVGEFFF